MSELDLDALERYVRGDNYSGEDGDQLLALIQRVREAEAEVETCHAAGEMQYEIEHNARIHAEERIAALERVPLELCACGKTYEDIVRDHQADQGCYPDGYTPGMDALAAVPR